MHPPEVVDGRLVFHHADPHHLLRQVQLACDDEVVLATRFRRTVDGWVLSVPPPDVQRLEYRLLITDAGGSTDVVLDPANPIAVPTAFGHRSVVELPGYAEPEWLSAPRVATNRTERRIDTPVGEVPVSVWAPAPLDHTTPAPLLVVHDGPEYLELAALGRWAAAMVATKQIPTFRMALLQPVQRDDWYALDPDWPAAVAAIVDAVCRDWSVAGPIVLMGASLGGLAALQTARATPMVAGLPVGGVFSQSGSFFQPILDPQESDYPHFDRIAEWTTSVVGGITSMSAPRELGAARAPGATVPGTPGHPGATSSRLARVALTCGRHEENHGNNVVMAHALRRRGHAVTMRTVEDLHNYTAWRDALDPALTTLLHHVWQDGGSTPSDSPEPI